MPQTPDHNTAAVAQFDFDLATPFFQQLLTVFDGLATAPLREAEIRRLESRQGVYGLFRHNTLVYVGKAEVPLPDRLRDHHFKLAGRLNIGAEEMRFKGVYLANTWVPLAPEKMVIQHYRAIHQCEWNGNGFGPHDPGRNREETNKPPDGFDRQFPINADWRCRGIRAKEYEANELLQLIKSMLPFCFRYETDNPRGAWRSGSTKYNGRAIRVPAADMPAAALIAQITKQLGPSWQATKFPSHIILYDEQRNYTFGEVVR